MNLVNLIRERLKSCREDRAMASTFHIIGSEIQFLEQILSLVEQQPEWEDLDDACLMVMAPQLGINVIRFAGAEPDPRTELIGKLKVKLQERRKGSA